VRNPHNQVFQDWVFFVDGDGELLQIWKRHPKADAADTITLPKCKDYSLFVFCSDVAFFVIDDEGKGWRMCQHVCYGRAMCTSQAKAQVGC
jgi:hypothetical protein